METMKRSTAIELCDSMIERYKRLLQKMEIEVNCPVCNYFKNERHEEQCNNCFNRPNDSKDITSPCVDFKTMFEDEYRVLYWNEVSKYLHSLTADDVFIGQLRYKCIEIDDKLI